MDVHLYIFLHFPKSSARYHVSFKNGMTEKINIEQSVIAYVIDARLPLIVGEIHASRNGGSGRESQKPLPLKQKHAVLTSATCLVISKPISFEVRLCILLCFVTCVGLCFPLLENKK